MSIPSSFIDQILDQSDIVDIIGRRVQLNKKGNNFWGICPFHDDTNPVSYTHLTLPTILLV